MDELCALAGFNRRRWTPRSRGAGSSRALFSRATVFPARCSSPRSWHSATLVEGRVREELRVLKLAARDEDEFDFLITVLTDHARRSGTRRVALRVQGQYGEAYRKLITRGARVRWTDLRMSADGFPEKRAERGVVFSNWEI